MHQNNIHNKSYDFRALTSTHADLKSFVFTNKYGTETIDFSNPTAVLHLNKAILKHHYGLVDWNIPDLNFKKKRKNVDKFTVKKSANTSSFFSFEIFIVNLMISFSI